MFYGNIKNINIINKRNNQFEKIEEKINIKNTNIINKRNLDNNETIEDIPRKNYEKKQLFNIEVKVKKKRVIKKENNSNENNIYNNTTKIINNDNNELKNKTRNIIIEEYCPCEGNCLSSCIIY